MPAPSPLLASDRPCPKDGLSLPQHSVATARAAPPGEDEELNSDDDSDGSGDERTYDNIVLAQYESVRRNRNKWIAKLRSGIARLNGVDYVFTTCTAEWEYT
mmetsp:Transcript_12499/g.41439  ORF Transcript_12499/g.41439 Transcript_12499/m.41439 type:complete len:102 (-) Transcript_12499:226-531(-)